MKCNSPGVGPQTLTVTFTPAVTIDYTTATASVALTVVPAVPPSTTFGHFVYTAGTPDGPSSTNLINGYSISGATGDLTAIPNTPFSAGDSVIVMAVHPSGNFVYAATTGSSGSHVAAFTVDSATGELTPVSGSPFAAGPSIVGYNGGVAPDQILALDPSGKFLYVGNGYAGYGSYQVHGFAVDAATGALTPISQAPVQGAALAMGPRGRYLYASGYSASEPTTVYSIDPTSGALTQVQETPGCGGLYMTIESSGRFLYATGALGGTSAGISASQIDPSTGMLTPLNGSPFSSSPYLDGLAIHPSGAFLYAVAGYPDSGNTPDFVEGYAIDAATGALTAMQSSPFQLPPLSNDYYHLYGVSVEPHGNYVYAIDANYGVVSYSVNRTTGELSLVSNSFTFQPAASVLTVGNQNLWDPGVIWPTPAAIDYGTTLSGTQLDASASVPGTFTYSPAAGDVLTSGPQTLTVTFVPNDTADFTTATASVNLTVEKATPAISWTTPPAIIYGTGLGSGQLNATSSVAGTFAYSPAAGTILGAGPQTLSVTFTPTDSANYKTATSTVTLTVNQATPAITWPTPTAITYGTALTSIQLDASSTVAGTLAYSPAAGIVLGAGPQTLTATFTPTDTTDYKTATASVTLTVNQATPTVNWSPPAAITYGAALSAGQLDATSSVAGTFAYSPATGTVLSAGLQTLSVTFTPTDLADYKTATAAVKLTVNPATPPITWTTPAAITYGTALSSTQLDASTGVAGTFTYSPAAGTVLSVGSQTLAVSFTPTDSVDYKTATATVTLTVNQATPTTSWQAPTTISYGTALGAAQLDATSSVVGTFAYSPAAGTVLSAGLQTLKATFTSTDTSDYTTATATVTLTVNEVTPTITWATPSPITYGAGLGSNQLNATASVAGTFVYTPTAGTVLGAGAQTLTATFTPTDTTDYKTATANVTLIVNQAAPTIAWATPAAIVSGPALSATQLDATASVPGTFVYNPASGATPAVGDDTLSVTFAPTDNVDYATATATVTLTVNPPPNPVPFLGHMTPAIADAGGAAFTITVNGSGFLANSTVYWGTTALTTQFVSSTQLTATVTAADIATAGATAVNVQTPAPGGGTSDVLQFEVDSPSATATAPTVPSTVATVTAGTTATYSISFPASVTNANATCLNLPAGAVCSYSFATGVLTISTSSTTPAGTYQVTVVFAETVASTSSALILLPILLLPLFFPRKRLASLSIWPAFWLCLILSAATVFSVGCGGSSSPTKTITTQSVTSSGVVGMTVQ